MLRRALLSSLLLVVWAADYPTDGDNSLQAGGGGSCNYRYEDHDGSPVVVKATCTISSDDLDQGCDTDDTTRAYARKLGGHDGFDSDDAGHILAHRLGGNGKEPTNIFPQAEHDNRGPWREYEGEVYDCITGANGMKATLTWTFDYTSGSKQRPSSMQYATSYDYSRVNATAMSARFNATGVRTECRGEIKTFPNQ